MKTCRVVDFAVPGDCKVKIKECEKREKYIDLNRELTIWNMKVVVIPIVISALRIIPRGLVKGLANLEIRG